MRPRKQKVNQFPPEQQSSVDLLLTRIEELREGLRKKSPSILAASTAGRYDPGGGEAGELWIPLWSNPVRIGMHDLVAVNPESGQALDPISQAMLVYHLHTADGAHLSEEWIAFSELPDGRFYASAFQGYTGHKLSKFFGNDLDVFAAAADGLGANPLELGDCARGFQILPRVAVGVVAWQGDEGIPPSYRLLFDAAIQHQLPTDACAVLGSILTGRLIRAARDMKI